MGKNFFSKHIFLTSLVLSLIVSCAHREVDPDVRSNPYDPGSGFWKENASPVVIVRSDSLWYDFNHSKATGTIRIHIGQDDLNFPYDTLTGSVFLNGTETKLPRLSSKKDTTLQLSGIKPGIAAQCTVVVYDSKQSVTSKVLNLTVPDSIPAMPPQARIINSELQVTLTWPQNSNTNYIVYYSDSLKGSYSDSISVTQTSNSTVSVTNQPSGYLPRYYIVATKNKFGTARSTDTLIGRKYYSGTSTPSINSITQGTNSNCIVLSIYNYSYDLDHIEIFRSTSDTSAFRLIGKMNSNSNYSSVYYYDSVKTSSNYYYRICAIDKQGRCSFPSSAQYGYLQRLYAPSLTVTSYSEYLRLSWYAVSGAVKYRVYRSTLYCIDNPELLTETNLTSCTDTPPTGNVYYYSVSGVASNGLEGSKNACMQGKSTGLPQPDSIVITSNYYPRHLILSWKKVTGASGYIIYRSNLSSFNDALPIDTLSSNTYYDTLPDCSLRHYQVVAYNSKGTGVLSPIYSGSTLSPTFSNYLSKNDSVYLTFTPNSRAIKYFVYRSSNQTDFTLIDSTTTPSYNAPLKDFSTWYYRFTILVPEGVSYPSATVSINRQLNTPSNIQVVELLNSVIVKWNKVMGAEQYDICRSVYNNSAGSIYRTIADTFFIDTIPEGSPLYYYFVRSKNSVSYSPVSVGYPGSRLRPPSTPASISVTGQLKTIYLSWGIPAISTFPTGFNIYRSIDNITFKKIDSTKSYTYYDTVPDTMRYYYRISAYNAQGESSMSNSYFATLTRPTAPQNLTGTLATSKAYICITWSPVSSINKYSIYRSLSTSGTYSYIGSVENTNVFYDSTCNVNTTYYYKVTSVTTGNQSTLSAYTIGIRLGPPAMSEVQKNDNGIYVSWISLPYSIQYYYIYRADSSTGSYVKIDSTIQNYYTDIRGTEISFYKVSTRNVVESELSTSTTLNTKNFTLALSASQGSKTNMVDLSWTSVSGAIGYRIYRAPRDSFNRTNSRIAEVTTTTYTDNVQSDSIYYYKITILKSTGESGFATITTPGYRYPSTKPQPISAIFSGLLASKIFISWYPPPTSVGYNNFNIYRAPTSAGPFEIVGLNTITTPFSSYNFFDTPPQKAPANYWYYVTVVNQRGESVPSDTVSGSY